MPSKKKKYNSRFPPARIKKIMQSDDEVGKVAAVVPIIISRVLEIFVENLLKDSSKITRQRNARTLTPAHIKASILQNSQLDFLKEIVSLVPDIHQSGDDEQVNYHQTVNYANHFSIPSANHHLHPQQLIRQQQASPIFIKNIHNISNTQTSSSISKLTVKKVTLNTDNQKTINDDSKISTATSSFLISCNKRFKNTFNRSNSAPCTTSTIKENLNKNELTNERAEDEEDDDAFDDEDEDSSYSDSSSSKQNKNNFNDNNELPCSSIESYNTKNVLDQLESCKVTKNEVENEDDDYDA